MNQMCEHAVWIKWNILRHLHLFLLLLAAFCVYNGVPYKQGESWKVGCEKICRCDDAMNSQINCDERFVFHIFI